jgi:branched-subunit amino acid aminotransferase/4-amino-4-deoxychorismate lyase
VTQPEAIAWIDEPAPAGRWGRAAELALPLSDRGLLLADGIFETMLVLDGRPRLLAEHLWRWQEGAALLGMDPPPPPSRVEALIEEAIARSGTGCGALRLNWSRGSPHAAGARGLAIPAGCRHRFWLQLSPAVPCFEPVRVLVSPTETRSATSVLSRAKTFAYGSAIQARRQAAAAGAGDALLRSAAGGLCCATSANLLVHTGGVWCTPPLSSGCLPGVMRARALELGLAREAVIEVADLAASGGALLLNSLGCRPISHLEGAPLRWQLDDQPTPDGPGTMAREAERLWRRLLAA